MSAILIRVGIKHLPHDSAKPIVDDGLLFSLPSPVPWPEPLFYYLYIYLINLKSI